jgi:hypothetical protein
MAMNALLLREIDELQKAVNKLRPFSGTNLPGGLGDPDDSAAAWAHGGRDLVAGLDSFAFSNESGGIGLIDSTSCFFQS